MWILAWTGIRKQELEYFLNNDNIDIAIISEIHFTSWTFVKIKNYQIYTTKHLSDRVPSGTTDIIKKSIKHQVLNKYAEKYTQMTSVCVEDTINHSQYYLLFTIRRSKRRKIHSLLHSSRRWIYYKGTIMLNYPTGYGGWLLKKDELY